MKNRKIAGILFLSLLFSSAAVIGNGDFRGSVNFIGPDGEKVTGARCAVVDVSPTLEVLKGLRESQRNARYQGLLNVSIPVAFHVITSTSGQGNVSLDQINQQISVLNEGFSPHGVSFSLHSVDVTTNDRWYTAGPDSFAEQQMKSALAIDPAHVFNVYTSNPGQGLLGWATFPWYYAESDAQHGVVILFSTMPGGSADPFNEGDTLTHETGHYLGLFHTFQGGCRRPGDFIVDTPAQRSPTSGCPVSQDTCGFQPGLDPINNFMDYSTDACMTEFTRGQRSFMSWAVNRFRPSLISL